MASIINASTSGAGGLITTADNTGNLNLQSNGTTVLGLTSGGVAVTGTLTQGGNNVLTSASLGSSTQAYSANLTEYASTGVNMRNRIINGDMRIDQRNAGASGTATYAYTVDRWGIYFPGSNMTWGQNLGSVTPPNGFKNYLGIKCSTAFTVGSTDVYNMFQNIEGYNVSDLAYGTANAKTITLSFWVRSNKTGTFGGTLINESSNRSNGFSYTISSANTWEYKTATLSGDTTGTWNTTNGVGIRVYFGLAVGSSYQTASPGTWTASDATYAPTGATSINALNDYLYFTGVQLEVGSTATPFERRQYGQELALCQRYYQKSFSQSVAPANGFSSDSVWASGTGAWIAYSTGSPGAIRFNAVPFAVTMRAAPTMTAYSANNASVAGNWCRYNAGWADVSSFSFYSQDNCWSASAAASVTANNAYISSGGWAASAEL